MSEKLGEFLTEGLKRYPDAVATVRYFEDQILRTLEGVAQGEFWRQFVPSGLNRLKRPAGSDGDECWIHVVLNGRIEALALKVEYGIWWNAPRADAPTAVYATFMEPAELCSYEFQPIRDGVRVLRAKRDQWLYVPISDAAEVTESLETVLAELEDAAIKHVSSRRA